MTAAISAAALAMACGGGGEARPTPSATATVESPSVAAEPTPTASPTATPAPEPSTVIAYEVVSSPGSQEGPTKGGYVIFSWSSDSDHLELITGDGAAGATWVRLPLDGAPPGDVASLDAGSLYTPTWAGHGLVALTRTDVTDSANWKVTVDLFTESGDHVTEIAAPAGHELGQLFFDASGDLAVFGCHQLSPARAVIDRSMCLWRPDAEITVVEGPTPRALSPDGTLVITIEADEGTQPAVYRTGLLNLVTGERKALLDETGSVAWSPDGKQIAFSSGRDYPTPEPGQPFRRQIYVMNADGENQRRVTDETQPVAGTPQWQPR